MSFQTGTQINHYVLNNLIAEGGMGAVWHAWDSANEKAVAIKAVANDLIFDSEFKKRMQDEARRHQKLDHPNIIPIIEVFEIHGMTCIVMKLIEGSSLDRFIESKAPYNLGINEALTIIRDILNALNYAHLKGIVHRDVKPSNVMLDKDDRALLIDFGIALAAGEKRRTSTGKTIGTPEYMSPEQIRQPKKINHLSDVYSVGCVFYELLTGRPPFVAGEDGVEDTDFAIKAAHVNKRPTNPKSRVPSIPADVDELIMEALEKDTNERIPGCQEFLRLLEKVGTHQSDDIEYQKSDDIEYKKIDDRKYINLGNQQARLSKFDWIVGILLILLLVITLVYIL